MTPGGPETSKEKLQTNNNRYRDLEKFSKINNPAESTRVAHNLNNDSKTTEFLKSTIITDQDIVSFQKILQLKDSGDVCLGIEKWLSQKAPAQYDAIVYSAKQHWDKPGEYSLYIRLELDSCAINMMMPALELKLKKQLLEGGFTDLTAFEKETKNLAGIIKRINSGNATLKKFDVQKTQLFKKYGYADEKAFKQSGVSVKNKLETINNLKKQMDGEQDQVKKNEIIVHYVSACFACQSDPEIKNYSECANSVSSLYQKLHISKIIKDLQSISQSDLARLNNMQKVSQSLASNGIIGSISKLSSIGKRLDPMRADFLYPSITPHFKAEKAKLVKTDRFWNTFKANAPTLYKFANTFAGLWNGFVDATVGTGVKLGSFIGSTILGRQKGQTIMAQHRGDAWVSGISAPLSTAMQQGLFDEKGEFHFNLDNIPNQVGSSVANMLVLIYGGNIAAGIVKGAALKVGLSEAAQATIGGISSQIGLVSSSMVQQVPRLYETALENGLVGGEALAYSLIMGTGQSLLELVSPNKLISGEFKAAVGAIAGDGAEKVTKQIYKQIAKEFFKEIGEENLQEFAQSLAEVIGNSATNQLVAGSRLKDGMSWRDVVSTAIMTTLTTGVASGPGVISQTLSKHQKDVIQALDQNPELKTDVIQRIDAAIAEKQIQGQVDVSGLERVRDQMVINTEDVDEVNDVNNIDQQKDQTNDEELNPQTESGKIVENRLINMDTYDNFDFKNFVDRIKSINPSFDFGKLLFLVPGTEEQADFTNGQFIGSHDTKVICDLVLKALESNKTYDVSNLLNLGYFKLFNLSKTIYRICNTYSLTFEDILFTLEPNFLNDPDIYDKYNVGTKFTEVLDLYKEGKISKDKIQYSFDNWNKIKVEQYLINMDTYDNFDFKNFVDRIKSINPSFDFGKLLFLVPGTQEEYDFTHGGLISSWDTKTICSLVLKLLELNQNYDVSNLLNVGYYKLCNLPKTIYRICNTYSLTFEDILFTLEPNFLNDPDIYDKYDVGTKFTEVLDLYKEGKISKDKIQYCLDNRDTVGYAMKYGYNLQSIRDYHERKNQYLQDHQTLSQADFVTLFGKETVKREENFITKLQNFILKFLGKLPAPSLGKYNKGEIKQTGLGFCYAYTANELIKKTNYFETMIRTSISQIDTDHWTMKLPLGDPNGKVIKISRDELNEEYSIKHKSTESRYGTKAVSDSVLGFQIMEIAFIKYAFIEQVDLGKKNFDGFENLKQEYDRNGDFKITDDQLMLLESGWTERVLDMMLGGIGEKVEIRSLNIEYVKRSKGMIQVVPGNPQHNNPLVTIESDNGNVKFAISGVKDSYGQDYDGWAANHAYSIERKYQDKDGNRQFVVVNPRHTERKILMNEEQFKAAFQYFSVYEINIDNLFSPNTNSNNSDPSNY